MAFTPNMNLIESTPLVTTGPLWAQNIESNFLTLDAHDHTSGKGLPITPAALSIDTDLSFAHNNAINLRSTIFDSQSAPLALSGDLNSVYVVNGDLYYNNGSGTPVQITSGISVNVSGAGGITGLGGTTAAETYDNTNKVFIFTQSAGVSASLDAGPLTIRENVSSAAGITLQSPTGLAGSYTLFLPPSTPPSALPLLLFSTGQLAASTIAAAMVTPGTLTTTQVSLTAGILQSQLANLQIGTAQLVAASVTQAKLAATTKVTSSSSGSYSTPALAAVQIVNMDITITASGFRPLMISVISDGTGTPPSLIAAGVSSAVNNDVTFSFTDSVNGGAETTISYMRLFSLYNGGTPSIDVPPGCLNHFISVPTAGTHRIRAYTQCGTGNTAYVYACKLIVYEM